MKRICLLLCLFSLFMFLLCTGCTKNPTYPLNGLYYCEELRVSLDFDNTYNNKFDHGKLYNENSYEILINKTIAGGDFVLDFPPKATEYNRFFEGSYLYKNNRITLTDQYGKNFVFNLVEGQEKEQLLSATPAYYDSVIQELSLINASMRSGKLSSDFCGGAYAPELAQKDSWESMLAYIAKRFEVDQNLELGYAFVNISDDPHPELIWLLNDYTVLSVFALHWKTFRPLCVICFGEEQTGTIAEGKIYAKRNTDFGMQYEMSDIKTRYSGVGFLDTWLHGTRWESRNEKYYKLAEGIETEITKQEFEGACLRFPTPTTNEAGRLNEEGIRFIAIS